MNPTTLLSGLGTAIAAEPGMGAATTASPSAPGTAHLFLSLVAGMLDLQEPTPSATDGGAAAGEPTPGAPGALDEVAVPASAPGEVPAGATPVTGPAPGLSSESEPDPTTEPDDSAAATAASITVLPPPVLAQTLPVSSGPAAAPAPAPASVSVTDAAPVGVSTPVQAGPAPTAPATTDPAPATQASATQPPSGQVATDPAPADRLTRVAASATDDAAAVPPAPAPTATTQAAQVSSVTPLAPVAFARTAPVLAPQGEATAQRVTAQVFPEVVRVSGAGVEGGPRRVTLKLNPETLGEVHVVLTQRRGGLEISLAAGQDARQAITEGAPELHRLLESVGRGDARIVLRDLPASAAATVATPTPDGGAARTDVSTDLGGDAWSGAGRPGGEPATDREATRYRTPGSSTATDGIPAATIPSRSSTTDESRRPGGLDMSI